MRTTKLLLLAGAVVGCMALGPGPVEARREVEAQSGYLNRDWPRREVLQAAARAFNCGRSAGHFDKPILTVIDYSLPSTEPRLWVIDLVRKKILFRELVAHGMGSGDVLARSFSDRPNSHMSSLGLFRTGETYMGKHGLSLRLDGLEPGFNESARERAIVMHGAPYVSSEAIQELSYLGRSWGCPAVSVAAHRQIIDRIEGGSALFVYYPDSDWLSQSEFLHCPTTTQLAQGKRVLE